MRKRGGGVTVIGFDLSLRAPAACVIDRSWDVSSFTKGIAVEHMIGLDNEVLTDELRRAQRIEQIAQWAIDIVRKVAKPVLPALYVEDYAFSSQSRSVTGLAELRGVVQNYVVEWVDRVLVPISSTAWRKMLLGKLPREGSKIAAQAAVYAAGAPHTWTGDECDAFGVANYGRTEHGMPALSLA